MAEWDLISNSKGFKICHLNVRSILANLEALKCNILKGELDIIALSETWLNKLANDNLLHVEGYELVRQDRSYKTRGGGLCVYIRSKMEFLRVADHLNDEDCELMAVRISHPHKKQLLVVVIYRPPSGSVVKFIDKLKVFLNKNYMFKKMNILLIGDFNIDYASKKDVNTQYLLSLEKDWLLKQLIKEPTRITSHSKNLNTFSFQRPKSHKLCKTDKFKCK